MNTKQVHWVEHYLNGRAILWNAQNNIFSPWSREGFSNEDARRFENDYKIETQDQNGLLPYNNRKYYFAKGHLFANADAIFKTHATATYTYFNAVPQWQSINNGNWKSLENRIRDYSAGFGLMKIQTGGYGNADPSRIFKLSPNGPPIPKWIYKKVYISDNLYYLFNVYNDIFDINVSNDHWCLYKTNLCAQSGNTWYMPNYRDQFKGQMYCCMIYEKKQVLTQ
jgi:DNA/RNA endonuclease G (NUC1)